MPGLTAPAAAADLSDFDPGFIISDPVFYNSGTMTAVGVAAFLEARAPSCVAAPDGTPCLKNFHQTTTTRPADAKCLGEYTGASNEPAAQIIAKVAVACGINPRVILTMLQKERGLVKASGSALSSNDYRRATGYGCSDTAACNARYDGFFIQVYSLAWQLKAYALNPTGYDHIAGRANLVRFHPDATCGTSSVDIQNQATASLYNYTPYQPNPAAIAAGYYGLGDSCSSFGNRNFWLIFTDWFGSTTDPFVPPAGATYTPVTPSRVMSFQKIGAGQTFTLALPMAPAGATAVALNVTAANPSSNTYVSVCPGGTATTTCKKASNVNPYYGKNTPNMVIVKLGTKHDVTFYNDAGTVQLIADVQGWFVDGVDSGATYQPIAPKRVMAFTPVAAGKMVTLTIKDPPSGASAVALNVTAANPTNDTYISTCPGGTAIGTCKLSSSLNPTRGTNTPNMVIVKLGTGGTVSFYNDSGSVQLIADVQGWFVDSRTAGASYVPVDPTRSMAFQKVGTGRTYNLTLTGVPTGATAVALNLTSANQTKDTYVSVCPYGTDLASCKAASNLNPYRGKDIANLVVVKLGTGNRITFYNDSGDSELIADVQGWFVS
ncbi:MAG: hypothetical protein ACOH10_12395 [Rhodoglobus sp.]